MTKFVNFKKRSVTLPEGCKDLIDLLRPARNAADTLAVVNAEGGYLDFISKAKLTTVSEVVPVIEALEFPADKPWFAQVHPVEGDDFSVCFSNPGETAIPRLFLIFMDRPELKAGIRRLLGRHGLSVANLDELTPPPFAGIAVYCAWRIDGPLPEVAAMGALARQLLTEGLGLSDDFPVHVHQGSL